MTVSDLPKSRSLALLRGQLAQRRKGRRLRSQLINAGFGCLLALLLVGCGKAPNEEECLSLLDRYTHFMIQQSNMKVNENQRQELLEKARKRALSDPEFYQCSSKVSRRQYDCAMAANNADEIERCLL